MHKLWRTEPSHETERVQNKIWGAQSAQDDFYALLLLYIERKCDYFVSSFTLRDYPCTQCFSEIYSLFQTFVYFLIFKKIDICHLLLLVQELQN